MFGRGVHSRVDPDHPLFGSGSLRYTYDPTRSAGDFKNAGDVSKPKKGDREVCHVFFA